VSVKNNKILPIPETMQGISTNVESKEEGSTEKKKKNKILMFSLYRNQSLNFKLLKVQSVKNL
jgi:hypothetical protein